MRLLVVGAAGSGKTAICRLLRQVHGVNAVDADDEMVRLNGGVWPSTIEEKNEVVLPRILAAAAAMPDVVLFNSYMFSDGINFLRANGFRIALLEVTAPELRRRQAQRLAEEGWTNVEWLDWNEEVIRDLRHLGAFDVVVSGEHPVGTVALEIMRSGEI